MLKLKTLIGISLVVSVLAFADDPEKPCIPPKSVLCQINTVCLKDMFHYDHAYYRLSTTFEAVSTIAVGNDKVDCFVDDTAGKRALAKLTAEAEQLKAAGACSVVINNIEQ